MRTLALLLLTTGLMAQQPPEASTGISARWWLVPIIYVAGIYPAWRWYLPAVDRWIDLEDATRSVGWKRRHVLDSVFWPIKGVGGVLFLALATLVIFLFAALAAGLEDAGPWLRRRWPLSYFYPEEQ